MPDYNVSDFRYIDAHVHFFPERLFKAIWDYWARMITPLYPGWVNKYMWRNAKLLAFLKEQGIEWFTTLNYAHKPGVAKSLNEWTYNFCKVNTAAIPFGTAHPGDSDLLEYSERAFTEYGFKGFKLYPLTGFYPDDERMYPVYEKAEQCGSVMLFHTGVKDSGSMNMKYDDPIYIDNLAAEFPELKIVIAHVGFPWVDKAIWVAFCNANVFLEISGLFTFEVFTNRPVVKEVMTKILDCATLNAKTVFGSDGPRPTEKYLNIINNADYISDEDRKKVMGETADWLIHADNEQFRTFMTEDLPKMLFARMKEKY